MRRLGNVIERISDIAGYFSGWLVFLMMLLIVFEVFMRYALHQPPMVADEFSAYMLVALAFFGMAFTWKRGGHVRVTVLVSRLPAKVSSWIRLISLMVGFVFVLLLVAVSYEFIAYSFEFNLRSSTWLATPLQWPQMTVLIGFVLLFMLLIAEITKVIVKIRSGESVEGTTK